MVIVNAIFPYVLGMFFLLVIIYTYPIKIIPEHISKFLAYIFASFSVVITRLAIDICVEYEEIFTIKYTWNMSYNAPFIPKYIIHGILEINIPSRKYIPVKNASFIFLWNNNPIHKKPTNPNQNPNKLYLIHKTHPAIIPFIITFLVGILFGYIFL